MAWNPFSTKKQEDTQPEPKQEKDEYIELGQTGLSQYSGFIDEEWLNKLKGQNGIKTYREMSDNDDMVGAVIFSIQMLIRNVDWRVEPSDAEDPKALEIAEFVESCRNDMSHTWGDFINEALSMLVYGWSYHEICYKQRLGHQKDKPSSKYDDGLIGWRKIPIRSQDTLYKWEISDTGALEGMNQRTTTGHTAFMPIEKSLLFRTTTHKNNPEGRSLLRNAYRSWYFKKRIQENEGIGIERDLAGFPMMYVPPKIMSSDASADEKMLFNKLKNIVTSVKRDEQEGLILPAMFDDKGNPLFKFELLSTGGTRQFDTNAIIQRYNKAIATTVLADFLMLGQDKAGSFALSSDKTEMFVEAISAYLKSIKEVINNYAVTRLMEINNIDKQYQPTIIHGAIEKIDVEKWTEGVSKLLLAGGLTDFEAVEEKASELYELNKTQ